MLLALLVFGLGMVVGCRPATGQDQQQQQQWDAIAASIDAFASANALGNVVVLVGDATGTRFSHTVPGSSLTPDTLVGVASASKWVAGAVILRAIEDGTALELDDKPSLYWNWWTTDPGDRRSKITLRHLLSFTAGFTEEDACLGDDSFTLATCARQIYDNASVIGINEPGTKFYYNGNNLQVAGAMLEAASGLSWASLFATYWKVPLGVNPPASTLFRPLSNPQMAGGLVTSAKYYIKFLVALLDGNFFQDPATVVAMLGDETSLPAVAIDYSPLQYLVPQQEWHYCLANWLECEASPFNATKCNGDSVHSSPGKFGFYPRIDFKNEYWSLVVRQDTANPLAFTWSVRLFQNVEPAILRLMTGDSPSPPGIIISPTLAPARAPSSARVPLGVDVAALYCLAAVAALLYVA